VDRILKTIIEFRDEVREFRAERAQRWGSTRTD
jgi:hypothetical protein